MEGHEVASLGGVGHGELSEGFFGLTSSLLDFGATIKVPPSFPKIQFYINTANTLSYICTSSEILFTTMFLKCSIAL